MSRYVEAHRGRFGVEPICRALDLSAFAYHQRKTGARSNRASEDERLSGVIRQVTHDVLRSPAALENVFRHLRPGRG